VFVPRVLWLVVLSEEGAVATQITDSQDPLATTGMELTEGKRYWEVELLSENTGGIVDIVVVI
jgi:hypothetical protein